LQLWAKGDGPDGGATASSALGLGLVGAARNQGVAPMARTAPAGSCAVAAACRGALGQQGYSLALRHLCHRWAPAAALAEALEEAFGLPAGGNLYATPSGKRALGVFGGQGCKAPAAPWPDKEAACLHILMPEAQTSTRASTVQTQLPAARGTLPCQPMRLLLAGAQGLKAHTDPHCVLVFQLEGAKRWLLAPPPPAAPPPLAGEPQAAVARLTAGGSGGGGGGATSVVLMPGDCLYIPRGWAHEAAALVECEGHKAGQLRAARKQCAAAAAAGHAPGAGADAAVERPSLHLTLGLEAAPRSSWWGLLHTLVNRAAAAVCDACGGAAPLPPHALDAAKLLLQLRAAQLAYGGGPTASLLRRACPLAACPKVAGPLLRSFEQGLQHPGIATGALPRGPHAGGGDEWGCAMDGVVQLLLEPWGSFQSSSEPGTGAGSSRPWNVVPASTAIGAIEASVQAACAQLLAAASGAKAGRPPAHPLLHMVWPNGTWEGRSGASNSSSSSGGGAAAPELSAPVLAGAAVLVEAGRGCAAASAALTAATGMLVDALNSSCARRAAAEEFKHACQERLASRRALRRACLCLCPQQRAGGHGVVLEPDARGGSP
jgi:hypothetical protein